MPILIQFDSIPINLQALDSIQFNVQFGYLWKESLSANALLC